MLTGAKKLALAAIKSGWAVPENPVHRYLELTHLRGLLRKLDIDCVLDVGANTGQFAHELRAVGYAGHIVSFEPLAAEFATLQESFRGDSRWQGFNFALGSEDTQATINVVPAMTVMSSLLRPMGARTDLGSQSITVRRLDTALPEFMPGIAERRIFLKMDTQGYDLQVFRGLGRFASHVRALQSEISIKPLYEGMPHYLEALSFYEQEGFQLNDLSLVSRTPEGEIQEMNCFMTNKRMS